MAYSSSLLRKITDAGLFGSSESGPNGIWLYRSTAASTEATATGYFARAGIGSRSPTSQAADNLGMRVGDIVIVSESTGGATPGRTTIHSAIGSTANQASTSASTGFNAGYDVSISST
ncbi:MAG: hypothetical protein IT530_02260 [Burkholderiales bacterium]|nr:hypothetical protein [Burkholderiales bacterium]